MNATRNIKKVEMRICDDETKLAVFFDHPLAGPRYEFNTTTALRPVHMLTYAFDEMLELDGRSVPYNGYTTGIKQVLGNYQQGAFSKE